ncbi:MAG: hypothetical protein M3406_02935, partial [Chloroflexota bacterium]|nr:hypothetical protein [Chloroflexota bacterium]
ILLVVDDLEAAIGFFAALGLELETPVPIIVRPQASPTLPNSAFDEACDRHGITFHRASIWTARIRERYGL